MPTREEIREGIYHVPQSNHPNVQEGIAKWLHGASTNPWKEPDWEDIPEWRRKQYRKNAYFLMVKLGKMGVVKKVDRKHDSDCAVHNMPAYPNGPCDCRVLPVGCEAVEPLIKEEINEK